MPLKDYLGVENARNKKYARLYEDLLKRAFGPQHDVLVGHHITFEEHGNIDSENEVPAADTLLFDHEIMCKVFGKERAIWIMRSICLYPADNGERERFVQIQLEGLDAV